MATPRADGWMPDFCRLPRLAMTFAVAEPVVLVLVLSPDDSARANLGRFVSASAFAPWLALTMLHGISRLPGGGRIEIGQRPCAAQHRPPPRLHVRRAGADDRRPRRGLLSGRTAPAGNGGIDLVRSAAA